MNCLDVDIDISTGDIDTGMHVFPVYGNKAF